MRVLAGRRGERDGSPIDAESLDRRLGGLRRAVHAATGRLPAEPIREALGVLDRADQRLGVAPDLTVVALAGATGAGKSTLLNAVVGEPVATAGVTRPTTSRPLAALWTEPARAGRLLDWLGVSARHVVADLDPTGSRSPLDGLVLLDLPDMDSTQADHRATVDHLLERVDVMIWVSDPQKYADALLHDQYLARFARHADVTIVLLNQVDRLSAADAAACTADLAALVAADGLRDTQVRAVSASTGEGMAEVRDLLAGTVAARRAALARLAADVSTAAAALASAAGDEGASLRPVPARDSTALAEAMTEAAGVRVIEDAVRRSRRRRGAQATGWPPVRWVHRLRRDPLERLRLGRPGVDPDLVRTSLPSATPVSVAAVGSAARTYAARASSGAPAAWVRSTRTVAVRAADSIGPHLDTAVARAEVGRDRTPRWWWAAGLVQWALALVAAAGALWLLAMTALRALALPVPEPPRMGQVPIPTLLLVGGLLLGAVLAGLAALVNRVGAGRSAGRARRAVAGQVGEVARSRIVEPVSAELATLSEFRIGLVAAQGG